MTTLTAYAPFNANAFPFAPGATTFTIATSTHLQEVWGNTEANYYGTGFTFGFNPISGYYLAAGIMTGADYRVAGVKQFEITGLNHSATTIYSYLVAENAAGLYSYVLSGADTFIGSSGNDVAYGYDGNDVMSASAGNDIGYGGSGDDTLDGGAGNDTGRGDAGNDVLDGGAGDDTLDGGAGTSDTAVYGSGVRANYTIPGAASGTVTGPEGTDTVSNIERYQFPDQNLAFDLGAGQAGGNTVRIIGAAFDTAYINPTFVGIGLDLFDGGMSMLEVCALALDTSLYLSLAGSASNVDFVNTVYRNVVGVLPSAADRDFYVGLLQGSGGTMSQAQLLEVAANVPVNELNINLVGLQASGVEYL